MSIKIHPSRQQILKSEFQAPYFQGIKLFLQEEKRNGKTIYPRGSDIFKVFDLTPFDKVKVVILGQDPYHGLGQAMGLSFSVPVGITPPPSLKNIYKKIKNEYPDYDVPISGDLTSWATQGVLLLNSILTVEASKAASHRKIGREQFTDAVISSLSKNKSGIIFLLWGNFAISKSSLIDITKHYIISNVHPSPLSAYRGWFDKDIFLETNKLLREQGKKIINW